MGIAQALTRLFNGGRTTPEDPRYYLRNIPGSAALAGVQLTMDNALQLSVVWACIDAITKAIASSRWSVYTLDGRSRKLLPDDPVDYLLNVRPNPENTAIAWKESMLYAALTWGNGYSEIVRDNSQRVAQLWPLAADRMTPNRDENGELVYDYTNPSGGTVRLRARDVYHLRGPSLNGLMGENAVSRAARSMALALATERFTSSYFANGTVVSGVLEYPKVLDDRAYLRLKKDWEEKRSGPSNQHKPLILEGGMKYTQMSDDPGKAQLVESRKFQVEEICRWYGVPPHKVQHLERSTFNNIEHLGLEFVRDALTPWALRMEQEADFKLFPARGVYRTTKVDIAWLSQGDFKSRMEGYQIARRMGVFSANDVLEQEGRNTIGPEGDVRVIETNMQTLDQLTAQKAPEIFQYHIAAGIPTVNEVRARLKLPPRADGDEPTSSIPAGAVAPGQGALPPGKEQDEDAEEAGEKQLPPKKETKALPPAQARTAMPHAVVRDAIVCIFASAIERYAKKLENREADLLRRRLPAAQVAGNLAQERERLRPGLMLECRNALELLEKVTGARLEEGYVFSAADAVDNGGQPRAVAEQLVSAVMEA